MDESSVQERLFVAVVGGGSVTEEVAELARGVGRALAESGAVVVCGGLGGVMEAACKGAREGGGTSVGILPGYDRSDANPFVDVAIPTGMGEARNALVVRAADSVIAVAGEYGTLSEIALALATDVPVVGLMTWELAKAGAPVEPFGRAETPEAAVTLAVELAKARRSNARIAKDRRAENS